MRRIRHFSAVLTLFLLVPASITWAQTITSQKGLTTAVFTTTNGTIKVYLPDDIRPGDHISGRIAVNPAGVAAKQIGKNLDALNKYSLQANGTQFQVGSAEQTFQFTVPASKPVNGLMELLTNSGQKAGAFKIPSIPEKDQQPVSAGCVIPTHALTGSLLRVTGPFDGNSSNTNWTVDNVPMTVIVESPRELILFFPADAGGPRMIRGQENGNPVCSKQVSGVQLFVSAGKLDLSKGEKTFIDVRITGLQHLPDTAVLTLTNASSGIVMMQPSNRIVVPLIPDQMSPDTFSKRVDIQSIKAGSFVVNVNLDLPEAQPEHPGTTTANQCNCHADCSVVLAETRKGEVSFAAKLTAECTGNNCSVAKITYKWHIGESGREVAAVDGLDYAPGVTVKLKKPGPYTIYLNGTVTCSDGATCEFHCNLEQSAPPDQPPTTFECGIRHEWCAGPAIKLERYDYYPKDPGVLASMRPGDLIGLSAFASDIDYLLQFCKCPEGEEIKKHPANPDEIAYSWEPDKYNHGSVIIGDGNSLLYQLPYCYEDYPVTDKVTLTIRDSGKKGKDEEIKLEYYIRVDIEESNIKEKYRTERKLRAKVITKVLNTPAATECKDTGGGDCVVLPWEWEKGSSLNYSTTITLKAPADKPPDNLLLLQTSASDKDDLELKCLHRKTGAIIPETLLNVIDPVDITWDIVSGNGSFPLGKKGPAVVFVHNYLPADKNGSSTNEVTIRCTISDSRMQATDLELPAESNTIIHPRIQPIALVGVGDVSYMEYGEEVTAKDNAKLAVKRFEEAGYNAVYDPEILLSTLESYLTNNACQALLLLGHGNEYAFKTSDQTDFPPIKVETWTQQKWDCRSNRKQPTLRFLALLSCETGKGYWYRNFFSLENYFAPFDAIRNCPIKFLSEVTRHIKNIQVPPPRIPDR